MKKKILIIDDEVDFGFLMKSFFTPKNYTVAIAHTLATGMKMLDTEKPDILFLDNNLPDGMGWEKAAFILTHYPTMRLNLISAVNGSVNQHASVRILTKPLRFEEIEKVMEADGVHSKAAGQPSIPE